MSVLKSILLAALAVTLIIVGVIALNHRHPDSPAESLRTGPSRHDTHPPAAKPAVSGVQASPELNQSVSIPSPLEAPPPLEIRYRNAGRATPGDTLQTFAWACDQADTALMRQLIRIEPGAETKLAAYYASLPGATRAQWTDVMDMAASLLVMQGMQSPFPAADILALATFEPTKDGRYLRMILPGTSRDGTLFEKTPAGWSYVISEAAVDAYIAYATRPQ